jgi:hypothetical protein
VVCYHNQIHHIVRLRGYRAICDDDGPKVAKWFYEELFVTEIIVADRVAYALDAAVSKLRQEGVPLDRWAPFIHMGA